MAETTRELIIESWYLSGIVSREFQTVTGEQISDGLRLLNKAISFMTADNRKISYFTKYDFVAVTGQEEYFIPGLIEIQTLTFQLNNVRYSMKEESRTTYFGTPRANDIQSLPYMFHVERTLDGSNLFMYYLPNTTYAFKMYGKFSLANVTLNEDMELTLDRFYIEYLRYLLAEYMCEFYNVTFPPASAKRLASYELKVTDTSPIDLSMKKMSIMQKSSGNDYYADANIGKGWRP